MVLLENLFVVQAVHLGVIVVVNCIGCRLDGRHLSSRDQYSAHVSRVVGQSLSKMYVVVPSFKRKEI